MTVPQLQEIFESPFDEARWRQVMDFVFPEFNFLLEQENLALDTQLRQQNAYHIKEQGNAELSDGERVVLYEVQVTEQVRLDRNVKTVRKVIASEVFLGYKIGMAVFHSPDKTKWRFTLVIREFTEAFTVADKKPESYTYVFGSGEKGRTAAERFYQLAFVQEKTLPDLEQAFSVEALSKKFFDQYKEVYQLFTKHVEEPSRLSLFPAENKETQQKLARDFVKKMMGRIVFLYFLQKKGWMGCETAWNNGDEQFMQHLFESAIPDNNFYSSYLEPLFFDTLNQRREDQNEECIIAGNSYGKVPFLNGGLFEREDKHPDLLTLDWNIFQRLFEVLNSYNFTIIEDDPDYKEVAVDPEMLGHIFENLLEDNKDKGAFYTPKEIVQYMCQESLIEYLTTQIGEKGEYDNETLSLGVRELLMKQEFTALNDLDQRADRYVLEALRTVKVCDPAIGSGAFPMGILHEIFRMVEFLQEDRDIFPAIWGMEEWNPARVKEEIIQHSIYGVDIEKGAVDIARLRFWLSIIIDEDEPRPLPNLDYKIVVGNSLLNKFEDQVIDIAWEVGAGTQTNAKTQDFLERRSTLLRQISEKQAAYFDAPSSARTALGLKIKDLKIDILINQLEIKIEKDGIKEEPKQHNFAKKKDHTKAMLLHLETRKWQNTIAKLSGNKKTDQPFDHFDWELDFPEVLNPIINSDAERRGFDIVIGNPPYMRVQEIARIAPDDKKLLEKKYSVANKAYDLANLFFELAVRIANDRSANCYIFPHKFFNSSSTESFRNYLWNGKFVDKIVHFGANMVFNDADTYTCIAHFSPRHNDGFSLSKLSFGIDWKKALPSLEFRLISYEMLEAASNAYGTNQWIFFGKESEYPVFERLFDGRDKFGKLFKDIFQGIATSKDPLYFLYPEKEDDQYLYGHIGLNEEPLQVEKTFFKPILKGKDVQRYVSLQPRLYVFFPYQITDEKASPVPLAVLQKSYPKTYEYVIKYEVQFRARERGKAGRMTHWYGYIYPKNLTKFEQIKLSSMEICANHSNVTLNDGFYYHSTTVYSWVKHDNVAESYEYFLAIANSKLLWWFLFNTGDTLQGDARRFKTNYLNPFPLPKNVSKQTDALFKAKVQTILQNKQLGENTTALEQEVDALVFKLYQLTYEEVQQVTPDFWLDKETYQSVSLTELATAY